MLQTEKSREGKIKEVQADSSRTRKKGDEKLYMSGDIVQIEYLNRNDFSARLKEINYLYKKHEKDSGKRITPESTGVLLWNTEDEEDEEREVQFYDRRKKEYFTVKMPDNLLVLKKRFRCDDRVSVANSVDLLLDGASVEQVISARSEGFTLSETIGPGSTGTLEVPGGKVIVGFALRTEKDPEYKIEVYVCMSSLLFS